MRGGAKRGDDVGLGVGAIDPSEVVARRHDRAHRLVREAEHTIDDVALLMFDDAGRRALGDQHLELFFRHRVRGRAMAAEQAQDQIGGPAQQPNGGGAETGKRGDRTGDTAGGLLRVAQGKLCRNELPDHQG